MIRNFAVVPGLIAAAAAIQLSSTLPFAPVQADLFSEAFDFKGDLKLNESK